jgi:predicted dehydrogenase
MNNFRLDFSRYSAMTSRRDFLKLSLIGGIALTNTVLANTDAKQWKVAVVQDTSKKGLGGHGLDTAFRCLPNVEVVAQVDSNEKDIAKRMAVSKAKRHYPTLSAMFEKEKPDIAVLTSRLPNEHLEQIRYIAERGCHIYCEKPLAVSLEEADEIICIIEKHKIKLAVAHPRRYDLGYQTMKKLMESGKIGIPRTIQGWAKSDHRGGGEDMLVLGSHILDLFVFMFGLPESVSAEVFVDGKPFEKQELTKTVEPIGPTAGDEIFAAFRFSGGVHGIFESKRNLYTKKDFPMGISIIGTKGILSRHFSDAHPEPQPLRYNNVPCSPASVSFAEEIPLKEERIISGAVPLTECFAEKEIVLGAAFGTARRFAVWDLMQAVQEDRQPLCSAYDARTVLEMIYGIYVSHIHKTPVEFPLKDRSHPLKDFVQ